MSAIAGSPYFDSYLYSQKLPFLNSSFRHDLFFMHSWDWSRDCYSDSISLSSLDGNRFTKSILRYGGLAAQTYKLVKM